MASLGTLTALEELDMRGCRGDHAELERKVWSAILDRRAEDAAGLPPGHLRDLEARAADLDAEARQLRGAGKKEAAEARTRKAARLRGMVARLRASATRPAGGAEDRRRPAPGAAGDK